MIIRLILPHYITEDFRSPVASINHVVCHIPSEKILKEGDILNVDVTAFKNGWHGDTMNV